MQSLDPASYPSQHQPVAQLMAHRRRQDSPSSSGEASHTKAASSSGTPGEIRRRSANAIVGGIQIDGVLLECEVEVRASGVAGLPTSAMGSPSATCWPEEAVMRLQWAYRVVKAPAWDTVT